MILIKKIRQDKDGDMTPLEAIISIGSVWGAFFLGYFFAKGKSKKHVEKIEKKVLEPKPNYVEKENSESTKPEAKKFNWI